MLRSLQNSSGYGEFHFLESSCCLPTLQSYGVRLQPDMAASMSLRNFKTFPRDSIIRAKEFDSGVQSKN